MHLAQLQQIETLADAASTLAHYWVGSEPSKDRLGVERLIRAFPASTRPALCALVYQTLHARGFYTQANAFLGMLIEMDCAQRASDDGARS
jgi:hypothetical protein